MPEARTLVALLRDAQFAAGDRVPVTRWPGAAVYRYRGRLFAVSAADTRHAAASASVRPGERCALGAGMYLDWKSGTGDGLIRARLPAQVTVQGRSGGERFHEAGKPHSHPLRKWLQERGVVPWQRATIPLVLVCGRLAAVGHIAVANEFAATPGEASWQLEWRQRPLIFESEFLADDV